ncbi:MAG: hypothetical protein ABI562_01525 [Chloroflexota bacterium]
MILRLHRDERGQSLPIILSLITVLFLVGTAIAAHISVALQATVANETQAGDLHAADAGAELGMWWQRNGNAGSPPAITINGLTVTTTVSTSAGVPCVAPSPIALTGFEHGVVSAAGGFFTALTGAGLSADAGVNRSGAYSLKVTSAAGASSNGELAIGPAVGVGVVRVYVRLASLPAADVSELLVMHTTTGSDLQLGYLSATKNLQIVIGSGVGSKVTGTTVIAAGTWYRIDLQFVANSNPHTAAWQIDGVGQPALSKAGGASTFKSLILGSRVAADAFTANYDDVLVSGTAADFPMGVGAVEALRPNGMGTNNTPGSFRDDDGTAVDAASYTRLDESPMSGSSDYVLQQTIGAADYVEVTFDDTTSGCVVGVSGLLAYHAAGTAGSTGKASIFSGGTERIIYNGSMSVTSLAYAAAIAAPVASTWTRTAVNALTARIGYSSDVTPNPYWDSLMLEVATGSYVPGTVTVTSNAGGSTITTTYTDVGSAAPTLLSWTTTR